MTAWETATAALTGLYLLDRAVKAVLVARFFARAPSRSNLVAWPAVALVQPVTRGATNLAAHLDARAVLAYPGEIRHIIVCDAADTETQAICRSALSQAEIVLAVPDAGEVASKVAKMTAGSANLGDTDVICFVDDDILLPAHALQMLIGPLYGPQPAGATFGLACQTSWDTVWESLMSGFVNANALVGYVPLAFFIPPYTITGHIFALRRSVFDATGGMAGMTGRFDDDHEIARRVRALGLPCQQTPLVYRVENALSSFRAYSVQMRRWFIIPRQAMLPHLTGREQFWSALLSLGNLLPPTVLLLTVAAPGTISLAAAFCVLLLFLATYLFLEARYLPARTPARRLMLLPIIAFVTPLQILVSLMLPGDRIEWRGQTYHARRGGGLERLEDE